MTEKEKTRTESWGLGKYRVEAVILREGMNPHLTRRVSTFPYTIEFEKNKYEVIDSALFEKRLSIWQRVKNILRLVIAEYIIIFWEGNTEPILRYNSDVDPEVILTARDSKAVSRMIKEWFAGRGFPLNKYAFIIIVALVGTIIYAKLSGRI